MANIEAPQIPMFSPHETMSPAPKLDIGQPEVGKTSFASIFIDQIASANNQAHVAKAAGTALADGRSDDIHGTMIELQKASMETKMVATAKNKLVDAFYELWRMSV